MDLFNAEQSSKGCRSDGTCYPASNVIDGDWNTASITSWATGIHWFQVSMASSLVDQIELNAGTNYREEITVSLYSGETLAGQCQAHPGDWRTETLSCDNVAADRVRLTLTSTRRTYMFVYEIKVKGSRSITPPGELKGIQTHVYNYLIIF